MRLNAPVLKSNAMQMEGKGTKIRLQNDITDVQDIHLQYHKHKSSSLIFNVS